MENNNIISIYNYDTNSKTCEIIRLEKSEINGEIKNNNLIKDEEIDEYEIKKNLLKKNRKKTTQKSKNRKKRILKKSI